MAALRGMMNGHGVHTRLGDGLANRLRHDARRAKIQMRQDLGCLSSIELGFLVNLLSDRARWIGGRRGLLLVELTRELVFQIRPRPTRHAFRLDQLGGRAGARRPG